MRPHRLAAALLAALLALTACSAPDQDTSAPGGAVLRVVVPSEPPTMSPVYSVLTDARVWGTMFDPLVEVDDGGAPLETGLLTDWTRTSSTTWRFSVREGVEFHNGEALDADAVVFTLTEYRDNPKSKLASYLGTITEARAVDEHTVEITTDVSYIALPQLLSAVYALPPGHYAEVGGDDFAQNLVGTGPFVLDSYDSGRRVSVSANPDYWRGAPALPGVEFTWAPDAASRAPLLQSGAADFVIDLPADQQEQVENTDGLTVVTRPSTSQMVAFFQADKEPFDDADLRRAAAMAIDRDLIVDTIFQGENAQAQPLLIGRLFTGEQPSHPDAITHDPDRARDLLDGDSPEVTLTFTTGRFPKDNQVGEALAGMLEEVGFSVTRNPLDYAQFLEERNAGSLQMYVYGQVPVFMHPDIYVSGFLTEDSITRHCVDPKFDELSRHALEAEDTAASETAYAELEDYALNEKVCNISLYDNVGVFGMSEKVTGFQPPLGTIVDWYGVELTP